MHKIKISWKNIDGDKDRTYEYTVQRKGPDDSAYQDVTGAIKLKASVKSFTDKDLTTGTSYRYRIKVTATDNSTGVTSASVKQSTWGKLDVNGTLDGKDKGSVGSYGTFDVYIDGKRVAKNVNDYCVPPIPEGESYTMDVGKSYEIKNIKATAGHSYGGVKEGKLSGKIGGTSKTVVRLIFTTDKYTVSFDDGSKSKTVTYGKTYGTLPTPAKRDGTFAGWYTKAGKRIESDTKVTATADHTLYAHWTNVPRNVTYIANNGTSTSKVSSMEAGSVLILPEGNFSAPTGKQFLAWNIGGVQYEAGSEYTVSEDTNITAVYSDASDSSFTVTFAPNGGSGSMSPITVFAPNEDDPSVITLPDNEFTAPEGMAFKSWEIEDEEYAPGETYAVENNLTVTAFWSEVSTNASCRITFAAGDGSGAMDDVVVTLGETCDLPVNGFVPPSGKQFYAWSIDGIEYTPGDEYVALADTTAVALWEDVQIEANRRYTITFDANGGTGAMDSITIEEGDVFHLPACAFTPRLEKTSHTGLLVKPSI